MKIGHLSSSERSNCIVTRRKTSTYVTFYVAGIELAVPVDDTQYDNIAGKANLIEPLLKAVKALLLGAKHG